jgi:hypothetical protein
MNTYEARYRDKIAVVEAFNRYSAKIMACLLFKPRKEREIHLTLLARWNGSGSLG